MLSKHRLSPLFPPSLNSTFPPSLTLLAGIDVCPAHTHRTCVNQFQSGSCACQSSRCYRCFRRTDRRTAGQPRVSSTFWPREWTATGPRPPTSRSSRYEVAIAAAPAVGSGRPKRRQRLFAPYFALCACLERWAFAMFSSPRVGCCCCCFSHTYTQTKICCLYPLWTYVSGLD